MSIDVFFEDGCMNIVLQVEAELQFTENNSIIIIIIIIKVLLLLLYGYHSDLDYYFWPKQHNYNY